MDVDRAFAKTMCERTKSQVSTIRLNVSKAQQGDKQQGTVIYSRHN
jgi:hypothetical protein